MEGVWKEKNEFKIERSKHKLEKWPESGDIRALNEVMTIHIPEEIVKSDKKDLEDIEKTNSTFQNKNDDNGATLRNKAYDLFSDGNDTGPAPLRNKDFQKKNLKLLLSHQIRNHIMFMTLS